MNKQSKHHSLLFFKKSHARNLIHSRILFLSTHAYVSYSDSANCRFQICIPYVLHTYRQIALWLSTYTWWRHQMETFSALLALCAGNSPVTGDFPAQRPVTRSFHVFFHLCLNKRLSKQSWGWWFETRSRSLWRHCNEYLNSAGKYFTYRSSRTWLDHYITH